MPEAYIDDGHVVEFTPRGARIECTRPDACKSRTGCETCDATGFVGEWHETPCPECDESGVQSPHVCWLTHHADVWDVLDNDLYARRHDGRGTPEAGRFALEWYDEDYGGDYGGEYILVARIGARVHPAAHAEQLALGAKRTAR